MPVLNERVDMKDKGSDSSSDEDEASEKGMKPADEEEFKEVKLCSK